MQKYKLTLVLAPLLILPLVSGEINFRSDQQIDFYNGVDMNNNPLQNLGAPQSNVDAVRMQELSDSLNRTDGTLAGDLNFNGYNAELRGGYISNDGDDEGIRVLDSGEVMIENGQLDLSGNSLTGLPVSDDSTDAVRQDQLSNYVSLNGDTLSGNLSLDNTYYITNLEEPENPSDAATKNYVESYADSNDNTGTDDQDLSIITDSPGGGDTTVGITNGSSVTFTDSNTQLDDQPATDDINANGYTVGNLSEPVNSNDAVRLQDVGSGFVNRTGDTLSGNLSFDNTYYVKDLPEPENSDDAATKNYVDINTEPDDQNLEEVLINGNSTGSYDLNLNSNNINNVDCLGDEC